MHSRGLSRRPTRSRGTLFELSVGRHASVRLGSRWGEGGDGGKWKENIREGRVVVVLVIVAAAAGGFVVVVIRGCPLEVLVQ